MHLRAGAEIDLEGRRPAGPLGPGRQPGAAELATEDEYGTIAERYPSLFNVESLGSDYDRAWVARVEGHTKVVGPSAHGLETYDVRRFGIDARPTSSSEQSAVLARKIDEYWALHRDQRETPDEPGGPSDDEVERLRSLGYLD